MADHKEWKDAELAILQKLDIAAAYRDMGVVFAGTSPTGKGWLACHAVGRADNNASAAVNVGEGPARGRYRDMGGNGDSFNLWEFAAKYGKFTDWRAARKHFAEKVGASLPAGGEPKRPDEQVEFIVNAASDTILQGWVEVKGGFDLQTIKDNGAVYGRYPKKAKAELSQYVACFPAYNPPELTDGPPSAWIIAAVTGEQVVLFKGKGKESTKSKTLSVGGSVGGLLGAAGLRALAAERDGTGPGVQVVWKVEGLTDLLTLYFALKEAGLLGKHVVISNSQGTLETVKPEWVELLAGKTVWREAVALFSKWRWTVAADAQVAVGLVLATFVQTVFAWRPLVGVTRTLIGARARGGRPRVPFDLIAARLDRVGDRTLLEFAFLDEYECRWVLANHPDRLRAIAEAALAYIPVEAVDRLLAASVDDGEWASTLIRQWVEAAFPGSGDPVRFRRAVIRAATRWLDAGRDPRLAVAAVCVALSPSYTEWNSDPADRYRFVRRFGLITNEEMVAVQAFWPEVRERLGRVAVVDWQPLQEFYRVWAYPGLAQVQVSQETVALMTGFSARLLGDLAQLWRDRPGLLHWAWQMAEVREMELGVSLPSDFVTLYPFYDRTEDWQSQMAREQEAARALAARWASEAPEAVAARLAAFEAEASAPNFHSWHRWSSFVCEVIARQITNPGAWADAFSAAGLSGDLTAPFLARAVVVGESGWEDRLAAALDRPVTEGAAVSIVLSLPAEPPSRLWEAVWTRLPRFAKLVMVVAGKQMPEARLTLMLRHSDPKVAAEAAMGEWYSEPAGSVRPGVAAAWREAVARGAEHVPEEAWELFPGLAKDWLSTRIARRDHPCHPDHPPDSAVFDRLTPQERSELLATLPTNALWRGEIVARLVGDDPELFACLLADARRERVRLAPLRRPPDNAWQVLATRALDEGIEPEDVARASFDEEGWFRGSESDHWRPWLDGFEALTRAADLRLREVGEIGLEEAERRIEAARREERYAAVYGDE